MAFATLSIILLGACSKKKGCMDVNSTKYDSSAQQDDGSCTYQGKVIYWWDQTFRDSCNSAPNGISASSIATVQVFLNGNFVGSLPVSSQFWTSAPNCGATAALTVTENLGSSKSKTFSQYEKYLDGSGNVLATTTASNLTLSGNTCTTFQFSW